jgi:periplasmic protein TorT
MKKIIIVLSLVLIAAAVIFDFLPFKIFQNSAPTAQAQIKQWWPREFWVITPYGERRRMTLTPPKPKKKYTIGVTFPHFKSPFCTSVAYGEAEEAKRLGVKLIFKAAEGFADLNGQISQVENYAQQGVDAILLQSISLEGNGPSAAEAIKRGIPVICTGQTITVHNIGGLVQEDMFDNGRIMAEWVIRKSGGKANVVVMPGPSGASWTTMWNEGVEATFKRSPGIKLLATKWCDIDVTAGQNITENLLQTFPNIDYILTSELLANGISNAIEAANNKRTKVLVDFALEESLPHVKKGTIVLFMPGLAVLTGHLGVDIAVRVLNGEKNAPWVINPEAPLITRENMNTIDRSILWAPAGWRVPAVVE